MSAADAGQAPIEVVIVNYNSTSHLLACLESVYAALGPATRVLVEDNASRDDPGRIRRRFPQAELTLHGRNLGFAAGVNNALARCAAPYVMLLNPDAALRPGGWLDILAHMEQNPRLGVVGPLILDPGGGVQGSARSFHSLHTAFFGRQALLTKWFPHNRLSRLNVLSRPGQDQGLQEVDWVSGACLLARRQAVLQVGGLDERFFLYFEDTDWCRRMWLAGWRVAYWPRAAVVHQIAASGGKRDLRPLWEFHKSCYRYLEKYALAQHPWLKPPAAALLGARFGALALGRLGRRWLTAARRPTS